MDYVVKKKLSEVILLYTLEPDLKDIYVEGITDKLCYSSAIDCQYLKIIEIDSIDFSELYDSLPELKRNNRRKLIELSKQFDSAFGLKLSNISCIVDTDFDFFSTDVVWNCYLKYTDYTSLEMYFFNENTLDKLFSKILHGFPITTARIIEELSKVLVELFFLRLSIRNCLGEEIYSHINIIDVKNSISIDRRNGIIIFEVEQHIHKILNTNGLLNRKCEVLEHFKILKSKSFPDNRFQIRGHDFIHLLFLLINKIKNSININEEILDRILLVCVCNETLKKERLITKLNNKYGAS